MKFDPLSMRSTFEKQKALTSTFKEAYDRFSQTMAGMGESIVPIISDESASSRSVEVMLVHTFGLKGLECIKSATKLVPKEIPQSERINYVRNIVVPLVPDASTLTDKTINVLINKFDDPLERDTNILLRTLSSNSGIAYTEFLAPPTSSCLNQCCRQFGEPGSLYQHHSPSTVSVFTFEGPKPATRICLKCRECSTIYNFNTYGKKNSGGEQFYSDVREYVEVSDVTYCDRRILNMYCLLR